jgi:leucyl-tRNA synthetase
MGYGEKIEDANWPTVDESALVLDEIEIPVQINGKMRGVVKVASTASENDILEAVKSTEDIAKHITGNIVKVIYVPKKILNIISK